MAGLAAGARSGVGHCRIVILGGSGVGKSSLVVQFVHARFLDEYDPTTEGMASPQPPPPHSHPAHADLYHKQCVIDERTVLLDILDTAGQEEFSRTREEYMQSCQGAILVFAVDLRRSFQEVERYHEHILQIKGTESFPMLLVGNKSDILADRQVSNEGMARARTHALIPLHRPAADRDARAEAKELARRFNCRYVETSARARRNVEEAFYGIVRDIRRSARLAAAASASRPDRCGLM